MGIPMLYYRQDDLKPSTEWTWQNIWTIIYAIRAGEYKTRGQWSRLQDSSPEMPLPMKECLRSEILKLCPQEGVDYLFSSQKVSS